MAPKKKARIELGAMWQYFDDAAAVWKSFAPADAADLESKFTAKTPSFSLLSTTFAPGAQIDFDLAAGTQTNTKSGNKHQIRRVGRGVWEYPDDQSLLVQFYDDDNDLIEDAWRKLSGGEGTFMTTALSWNKGYDTKYTFTFTKGAAGAVNAAQKNEDSGNVRQLKRSEPTAVIWDTKSYGIAAMAPPTLPPPSLDTTGGGGSAFVTSDVFAVPSTWQPQTKPLEYFTVAPGSPEFKSVTEPFTKTLIQKATIHSVERIQNEMLWKFYALTRHRVAVRNAGEPNEKLLYHGARVRENMNSIIEFGFDMRVARDGSAGIGIYFAVNASYSNSGYVLQNPDKSKEMFVCRVTCGSCVQGKHGLKRPPAKTKAKADKDDLHDSVHNGVNVMYIVFDNCQAYPEYLIKYTPAGF